MRRKPLEQEPYTIEDLQNPDVVRNLVDDNRTPAILEQWQGSKKPAHNLLCHIPRPGFRWKELGQLPHCASDIYFQTYSFPYDRQAVKHIGQLVDKFQAEYDRRQLMNRVRRIVAEILHPHFRFSH